MTGVLCPGDERDERVTRGQVAEEGSEDMTSSDPITSAVTTRLETSWSDVSLWLRNKISTQLPRCWAVLCLINDLIISNTVFQIAVTTLSLVPVPAPELLHGAAGSHLGGHSHPDTNSWKMTRKNKHAATEQPRRHFIPTNFLQISEHRAVHRHESRILQGVSHIVSGIGCKCL